MKTTRKSKTTPAKENKPSTPPIQQQQQQQNDITIIPETQLPPQTQTQETTQISFNSPIDGYKKPIPNSTFHT